MHLADSIVENSKKNMTPLKIHFYHEFSINIWCSVIDDFIVGRYELARLFEILQDNLASLLEDDSLAVKQDMWDMHDGAPAC